MYYDPSGNSFIAILGTLVLGTVIGAAFGAVNAALTGQNIWAGIASGAVSGFVSTAGMAIALATGGVGGLALSALFGALAGGGSSAIQQGMTKGWGKIDGGEVFWSAVTSAAFSMVTYGATSFVMNNSVGLESFDKTISFGARLVSNLEIGVIPAMNTLFFGVPVSVAQTSYEVWKHYNNTK